MRCEVYSYFRVYKFEELLSNSAFAFASPSADNLLIIIAKVYFFSQAQ